MKQVRLVAKDLEGNPIEPMDGVFELVDLAVLNRFIELMSRVRDCALLQRGMPAISNIGFKQESGLTLTCAPYTNAELYELLHVLRPVILKNEPASFHNISALLGRRFKNQNLASYLKLQRRVFEHGEHSLYMQITIGDQPLFDDSLLRLWLNAEQYHTDPDKSEAWRSLETSLRTDNVRALVMSQLQGKVTALFNLEHVVALVASDDSA
jgi:hypothetical protein